MRSILPIKTSEGVGYVVIETLLGALHPSAPPVGGNGQESRHCEGCRCVPAVCVAVVRIPFSISGYDQLQRLIDVEDTLLVASGGRLYRDVITEIDPAHTECFLGALGAFARAEFPSRVVDVKIRTATTKSFTSHVPNVGATNARPCAACPASLDERAALTRLLTEYVQRHPLFGKGSDMEARHA